MNCDVIAWINRSQPIVGSFSTMVDFTAVFDACMGGLSTYCFLKKFVNVLKPIIIYMDNEGSMLASSHLVTNKTSKHINLKFPTIQDSIANWLFELKYVSTDINSIDIVIKGLVKMEGILLIEALLQDVEYMSQVHET